MEPTLGSPTTTFTLEPSSNASTTATLPPRDTSPPRPSPPFPSVLVFPLQPTVPPTGGLRPEAFLTNISLFIYISPLRSDPLCPIRRTLSHSCIHPPVYI